MSGAADPSPSPAPSGPAPGGEVARPSPDGPGSADPASPAGPEAGGATDCWPLIIEHGPGGRPLLGLALLAWMLRRTGFLDGLTELSAFGVQLKRDVGRVDRETGSLREEIAALRAENAEIKAALAQMAEAPPAVAASASAPAPDQAGAAGPGVQPVWARLRVLHADDGAPVKTLEKVVGAKPLTIGRGPEADLRIDDPTREISRLHLELAAGPDGALHVRDLSTNATFIEGPEGEALPFGENAPLPPAAWLRMGPFRLCIDSHPLPVGTVRRQEAAPAPTGPDDADIARRVDAMLGDPRFEWRSVARLASAARMDPKVMARWLGERPDRYRLGRSGAGEPQARLSAADR
ncbi:MAG: FHA domain-containing protein [Pseudomonadota bacterium]